MQEECPVLVSCKPLTAEFNGFKKINITSKNDFSVGRGLHNSIVIPSIVISRSHCKFRKENDNWLIEDYSACGIEVNGVKVGKGNSKILLNDDIVGLDSLQDFVYKFIWPINHISKKRIKLETDEVSNILNDVKTKFEESQIHEMQHIENKIQKHKQLQVTHKKLQDELLEEKNIKVEQLEKSFVMQIENLTGEEHEVDRQKKLLFKERETQISSLKKELDAKINQLMEQIKKHNKKESELVIENNYLKEKLLKDREVFLAQVDKENTSKQDLLDKLNIKIMKQKELHLKEKQEFEKMLETETEKLRLAKDKELRALEELNKQRETELLVEHNKIKQILEKKIEDMKKESKSANLQLSNNESQSSQAHEAQLDVIMVEEATSYENMIIKKSGEVEIPSMAGPLNESEPIVKIGQLMENELQCSICTEIFIHPVMLCCGHTFCKYCINLWKTNKKDCPVCRALITYESRSLIVESFIDKILPNLSQEMKKKREESLKIREVEQRSKARKKRKRGRSSIRVGRGGRSPLGMPSLRSSTRSGYLDSPSTPPQVIPTVDLTSAPIPTPIMLPHEVITIEEDEGNLPLAVRASDGHF